MIKTGLPVEHGGESRVGLGSRMLRKTGFRALWTSRPVSTARYDGAHPLCFMHIPKASGTALTLGLSQAVAREASGSGLDHVLFGGFTAFDTFSPAERARIYDHPASLPTSPGFVAGHFAHSTLRQAYPRGQLMTVLREPVTRLMSLWMFWRQAMGTDLSGIGLWADYVRLAGQPLGTFLAEPRIAAQTDNGTLRQLLWPHPRIPRSGFIAPADDRSLLRLARQRLADFAFTGIIERPGFLKALQDFLGRPLSYERHNETDKISAELRSPFALELDAATLAVLETRSRLDLALWTDIASLPSPALGRLRQQTILQHVARYGALMAQ